MPVGCQPSCWYVPGIRHIVCQLRSPSLCGSPLEPEPVIAAFHLRSCGHGHGSSLPRAHSCRPSNRSLFFSSMSLPTLPSTAQCYEADLCYRNISARLAPPVTWIAMSSGEMFRAGELHGKAKANSDASKPDLRAF